MMKPFDIVIDEISYNYINSIHLNDKDYVAYSDDDNIYISEYVIENDEVNFKEIDDETFNEVKEAMSL